MVCSCEGFDGLRGVKEVDGEASGDRIRKWTSPIQATDSQTLALEMLAMFDGEPHAAMPRRAAESAAFTEYLTLQFSHMTAVTARVVHELLL